MTATAMPPERVTIIRWSDLEAWMLPKLGASQNKLPHGWKRVRVGSLVRPAAERVRVAPETEYKMAGVRWYGEGAFHRETVLGQDLSATFVTPVVPGALIYNRLFAWKASFAVVPMELSGCFVSSEFPQFLPDPTELDAEYLYLFCTCGSTIRTVTAASTGSAAVSRNRFREERFLELEMPLPPLEEQRAIVRRWREAKNQIARDERVFASESSEVEAEFLHQIQVPPASVQGPELRAFAIQWKDVDRWGVQMVRLNSSARSAWKFPDVALSELCRIGSGGTPSRMHPEYFGGGIPWVKTTEVKNEVILSTEETLSEKGVENSSARPYPIGSLIIAMYGQGATRGRTAKLGIEATTNQACAVLYDIASRVDIDYLWYFLMSQYESMRALASGNNQPNLNAEMIANLRIPVPPLDMQKRIVKQARERRSRIGQTLARIEKASREIGQNTEKAVLGIRP